MIKFAGAVLIILGTGIFGYFEAEKYNKRYKNLLKIDSCFSFLENEIEYSNASLDEIFLKIYRVTGFEKIFKSASYNIKFFELEKAWEKAVLDDKKYLCMEKSDVEILLMFGEELGKTNRKGQIKNIKYLKTLLYKNINDAHQKCKKEARLKRSISLALGILVSILLM